MRRLLTLVALVVAAVALTATVAGATSHSKTQRLPKWAHYVKIHTDECGSDDVAIVVWTRDTSALICRSGIVETS